MPEDVKPAESSPVNTVPSEQDVREFLKSGTVPDAKEAAELAESTEEAKPPSTDESEEESAPPKPKGREAEKRIRQLVREKKELANRLNQIEQQVQQVSKVQEAPKPDPPKVPQKPRLAEFETVEQYEDALHAYTEFKAEEKARKIAQEAIESYEAKQVKTKAESEQVAARDAWWNRVKESKPPDDYAEVTEDLPQLLNEEMASVILDSDKGPLIAYYLGNNPDEIERLKKLPPVKMVRELVSLEQKLNPWKPGAAARQAAVAKTQPVETFELTGGGGSTDPIAAALKAGDFATYSRLTNEKERSKRR